MSGQPGQVYLLLSVGTSVLTNLSDFFTIFHDHESLIIINVLLIGPPKKEAQAKVGRAHLYISIYQAHKTHALKIL